MIKIIISLLFLLVQLSSKEIGCNALSSQEISCEIDNPIIDEKSLNIKTLDVQKEKKVSNTTNITEKLKSIKIHYQNKEFILERKIGQQKQGCPPNCIQPMNIEKVKTIGELETLNFLQKRQKSKTMLLVDTRNIESYKINTIPTAINIPSILLNPKNKHSKDILKLLGGKKLQGKWYFKIPHKLLIFDNGIWDSRASTTIQELIKYGYPQNKILYYRGGIQNWTEAGLTLF